MSPQMPLPGRRRGKLRGSQPAQEKVFYFDGLSMVLAAVLSELVEADHASVKALPVGGQLVLGGPYGGPHVLRRVT